MAVSTLVGIWANDEVIASPDPHYAHIRYTDDRGGDITFIIWDTDKARELAAAFIAKADEADAWDRTDKGKPVPNHDELMTKVLS